MSRVDQGDLDNFEDDSEPPEPSPTPKELRRQKEFRELVRLFCEVNTAVNCMKIVREIERLCSELGQGFFVFAYRALFKDAISSLMRVLDEHADAFSVWKLDQKNDRNSLFGEKDRPLASARFFKATENSSR
jgi:hypothetical protein